MTRIILILNISIDFFYLIQIIHLFSIDQTEKIKIEAKKSTTHSIVQLFIKKKKIKFYLAIIRKFLKYRSPNS